MNSKKLLVIGTLALIVLIAGAAALYSSFSGMGHSPVPRLGKRIERPVAGING